MIVNASSVEHLYNVGDDLAIRPQWSNDASVVRPTTGKTRNNSIIDSVDGRRGSTGRFGETSDIWQASAEGCLSEDEGSDLLAQSIDLGNLSLLRNASVGCHFTRPQSTQQNLRARPSTAAMARKLPPTIVHNSIELFLLSSWGDPQYIGFSGICGIDQELEEFELPIPEASYYVYSLDGAAPLARHAALDGSENCLLVSNTRMTSSYEEMWVGQTFKGLVIGIRFNFDRCKCIKGVRIWNFNAGREDTNIGIKHMEISIDGGRRKAVIVRKAPGNCSFDYSQFLPIGGENRGGNANNRASPARPAYSKANSFGEYNSPSRNVDVSEKGPTACFRKDERFSRVDDLLMADLPSVSIVDDDDSIDSELASPTLSKKNCDTPSFSVEDHVCHIMQLYETPVIVIFDLRLLRIVLSVLSINKLFMKCRFTLLDAWFNLFFRQHMGTPTT